MFCEVCGEKKATHRSDVDGLRLAVCSGCVKFGAEVLAQGQEKKVLKKKEVLSNLKEDILPDYAEKLRHAREERGMSLKELADSLFEKRSVIEKVEKGKMLPEDKLTRKLEKFFGIKLKGVVDLPHQGKSLNFPKATLGDLATVIEK